MEQQTTQRPLLKNILRNIAEIVFPSWTKSTPLRFAYDDLLESVASNQHVTLKTPPSIVNGMLTIGRDAEFISLKNIDSVVFYPSPKVAGEIDMIVTKINEHRSLIDVYAGSFESDNEVLEETERLFDNVGIGNRRIMMRSKRNKPSTPSSP